MLLYDILVEFFTSKRAKSFYWRLGNMLAAESVNFLAIGVSNGELHLPQWAVITLGLVFAEITKALNKNAR